MAIDKCRICGHKFFSQPLLQYDNMPKAAQCLPDAASVESERGVSFKVWQCSGCGLVQLDSDPVAYYKEVIRAADISPEMKDFRRKQFLQLTKEFSLFGKKVIEIGCGQGEYLELIRESGVDAYGLEYSKDSVSRCLKRGLKVSPGFISDNPGRLDNAPFDGFYILNFLEHLPDPASALRAIFNNLNDQAIGLVEVPNFNMILDKGLFAEFIPDHLLYFTKATLNLALSLNGFEIIDCKEVWHEYIISAIVRKSQKSDLSYFYNRQLQITTQIKEYIQTCKGKKIAIWGAGHQALAVISLVDLAGKINYVIDSASFKQGKFTPATHIPIVSPASLKTDPVDVVIVMAASYSDEVVRILQEKFDPNINIAVLKDSGLEIIQG